MAGFYDDMADMVQELLAPEDNDGLGQGVCSLKRTTTTPPPNDWTPPTVTETSYPLKAAVASVATKYVDGTRIVASDRQVTFAVPVGIVPALSDTLSIDGKDYAMKDLRPIPGAGIKVSYIAFIGA